MPPWRTRAETLKSNLRQLGGMLIACDGKTLCDHTEEWFWSTAKPATATLLQGGFAIDLVRIKSTYSKE
jgi:hypothetical protein